MKFLNDGFRSKAYKDGNRIILIGKNEKSFKRFQKDVQILNLLQPLIKNIKIPSNLKIIDPCEDNPFGALSYDIIEGKILQPELLNENNIDSIVKKLSSFLKILEQINPKEIDSSYDAGCIIEKEKAYIEKNIIALLPFVEDIMKKQLLSWKEEYYKYLDKEIKLNFTHGDLWYENMIVDKDAKDLVGIIDFEHAGIFDKAIDYVPTLYLGKDFTNKLLQARGLPIDYYKTLRLFAVRRQIIGFKYIAKHFPEEIDEEIKKVKLVINDFI